MFTPLCNKCSLTQTFTQFLSKFAWNFKILLIVENHNDLGKHNTWYEVSNIVFKQSPFRVMTTEVSNVYGILQAVQDDHWRSGSLQEKSYLKIS